MAKSEPLYTEIGDFAVPRHIAIIMDGNGRGGKAIAVASKRCDARCVPPAISELVF